MAEQLQVQIGANIRDLESKLAKATRQLDRFKLTQKSLEATFKAGAISSDRYYSAISKNSVRLQKAGNDIKNYKSQLANLSTSQNTLVTSQGALGKSTNKLSGEVRGSVPTLTSFSQVIQDAPYGIRGVANNITQLTSQFGYLSKAAGGTKGALRAMLGVLAGPAGILLAVSAVTSLMVAYGDKLKFAASKTAELAKATAEYVGKAREEISTLNVLVEIAKDENNSKKVRERALTDINKKYSKYLGNLDLETIKTDAVTNSINKLSLALIQKAKIQGLESLIAEKTTDAGKDLVKTDLDKAEALKRLYAETNKAIKNNATLNRVLGNIKGDRERLLAFSELTKQTGQLGDVARQAAKGGLALANAQFTQASTKLRGLQSDLDDTLKPLVSLQESFKKGFFEIEPTVGGGDQPEVVIDVKLGTSSVNEQVSVLQSSLEPITVPVDTGGISSSFDGMQNVISTNLELFKERLRQFNEAGGVFVDDLVENGLGRMGEAIGNALVNGNNALNAIGGVLLSTIGDIAVRLGKTAIGIGIAMKGIKLSFKSPGVAIAAGVALVAIGSAMKSAASIVSGQGGSGSGYAGSQDYSGSNVTNTSYGGNSSSGGRVVFEIAGDKLIGVLNNTSLGNLRVGDSDQLITTG